MKHLKNNHNKLVGFVLLSLFIVSSACSCKRDCQDPTNPKCENYEPCYGKVKPSAKFIMEQRWTDANSDQIWVADSTFAGGGMRFRSNLKDDNVKHTWYVGVDVFDGWVTPIRQFDQVPRPQTISISHVIEYTPDLQCFPDDDGKDSVAQEFRLIAMWNDLKIYGTFRAAFVGTTDSFDINFSVLDANDQPAYFSNVERVRTINFHNEGDTLYSNSTANRLGYGGGTDYHAIAPTPHFLTMNLEANLTFTMTYKWWVINSFKDFTIKGRKIN